MLPKAILFDMDDTILKWDVLSELAWREACKAAAEKTRLFEGEKLLNEINDLRDWYYKDPERHRIGRLNLQNARRAIVKMALEKLGCAEVGIADEVATSYGNLKEDLIEFFPGTEDTLRKLIDMGIKLALVTNGEAKTQTDKIERFNLRRYFTACLIEGELGYGKPDPRMYEKALNKLGAKAEQTWMVGDDLERDIAGAQRAGIFSIWHDYGKTGKPDDSKVMPDRIINHISEVISLT